MQILINSQGLNMNPLQSLYYISPACLLCLSVPLGEDALPGTASCMLSIMKQCIASAGAG